MSLELDVVKGEFCRIAESVLEGDITACIRSRFVTKKGGQPSLPDYPYSVVDVLAIDSLDNDQYLAEVYDRKQESISYFVRYEALFSYSFYGGNAMQNAKKLRNSLLADNINNLFEYHTKDYNYSCSIKETTSISSNPTVLSSGKPLEVASFEVIVSIIDSHVNEEGRAIGDTCLDLKVKNSVTDDPQLDIQFNTKTEDN